MPRTSVLIVTLSLLLQAAPPLAIASTVTRAQYVEHAEPICKTNAIASRSILKGIRDDVRKGKLKRAGGKFNRAARALDQTIRRLERIPRPSADESVLTKWFVRLNDETKLLKQVAKQLLRGSTVNLERYVVMLRHNADIANNIVLTFGFEYCLIQTARYV